MNKELLKVLNGLYADLEDILSDESIMTAGKKLDYLKDELGSVIQGVKDGDYEDKDTETKPDANPEISE